MKNETIKNKMKNTGFFLVTNEDNSISKVVMSMKIRKPEKHIIKISPKYKSIEMVDKEKFFNCKTGCWVVL